MTPSPAIQDSPPGMPTHDVTGASAARALGGALGEALAIFPPHYPREYLVCLARGHSWALWRLAGGYRDSYGVLHKQWTREALWCKSCTAERLDVWNGQGQRALPARYTYPAGFKLDGYRMNELRAEARLILLSRPQPDPDAPVGREPAGWEEAG